jgi:hypothetical protein
VGSATSADIQLIHPSTPNSTASLILLPLPISSIPDSESLNVLSQISKTELKFTRGGSWTEDDDEPFSQAGMGGQKHKVELKREVDGMYM